MEFCAWSPCMAPRLRDALDMIYIGAFANRRSVRCIAWYSSIAWKRLSTPESPVASSDMMKSGIVVVGAKYIGGSPRSSASRHHNDSTDRWWADWLDGRKRTHACLKGSGGTIAVAGTNLKELLRQERWFNGRNICFTICRIQILNSEGPGQMSYIQ